MAEHLASIYGTEKDKINCPFYFKIGACRHGDRCSRVHHKPLFSPTILLHNLYVSPDQLISLATKQGLPPPIIPQQDILHHFEDFYYDIYDELSKHGAIDKLYVCENLADHLSGNTYVKFFDEHSAQLALQAVNGRYYAGRVVKAEFSPVTDFREGKCRPFENDGQCERGDFCHFLHLKRQPRPDRDHPSEPYASRRDERPTYRSRDRSNAPYYESRRRDERYRSSWYDSAADNADRERRYSYERPHSYDRYGDRERDRDHYHQRDNGRERDTDFDRNGDRDAERDRGRDRDRAYDRDRDQHRDRARDRYKERERHHSERHRERSYRSSRRDHRP